MSDKGVRFLVVGGVVGFFVLLLILIPIFLTTAIRQTSNQALEPIQQANEQLKTQVSQLLNPTPTIIPDPITIIHEVRALARLETIQFTVEKVVTAESAQGELGFLFGDRLLFVAHGTVIAGLDLQKMRPEDLRIENQVLYVRLPEAEVFTATLDNDKSYVFNRETGLLTRGDVNLETSARQVAETEILKAALEDGILETARQNGENYMLGLFRGLGFNDVIFEYSEGTPAP
ncbi:MAG: DUF4230 domain-containing protein [Chloroflexi bacterium]|jgi:hypothetical protein|nr:DUF4230 domain-containing protein [Chloroflexota bacterium]